MKRVEEESQKTHFWLKRPKKSQLDLQFNTHLEASIHNTKNTPLPRLLSSKEPLEHVSLRYELFNNIWKKQQQKIDKIFLDGNVKLFNNLLQYVMNPISNDRNKVSVGFLQLGSNIANNLRIFKELESHLNNNSNDFNLKTVTLNSSSCANIKSTIREIVKQITTNVKRSDSSNAPVDSDYSSDEEDANKEGKTIEDDELDIDDIMDDAPKKYHGKISYDFDIIADWFKETVPEPSKFRLVILLQDSDAISNLILNQFIKIICSYSQVIPMKLIIGLSSVHSNIKSWLNENISNDLRLKIDGSLFRNVDNKQLGHLICEQLFLQYPKIDAIEDVDNIELNLSPKLSSILMNRFQYSNNSIDALISSIKLSYMTFFYQSPLPVLLSKSFDKSHIPLYVDALKTLPSFKKYIELKFEENDYDTIRKALTNEDMVLELVYDSQKQIKLQHLIEMNSTNILDRLQRGYEYPKAKMEIYQLITSREIVSSVYLNDVFKHYMKGKDENATVEDIEYILQLPTRTKFSSDEILIETQQTLKNLGTNREQIITTLKKYFKMYTQDRIQLPFYEVFTILGGHSIELNENIVIKEKAKNLITELLRPEIRASLENGLENSDALLNNKLVINEMDGLPEADFSIHHKPFITKLFQVYKDAPVNINLYDFYAAFKECFDRQETLKYLLNNDNSTDANLIERLNNSNDNEIWDKLLYSWFLQGCFEFLQMGIIKEKPKGDYVEKVIWKGV